MTETEKKIIRNAVNVAIVYDKDVLSFTKREIWDHGTGWTKEHETYTAHCYNRILDEIEQR